MYHRSFIHLLIVHVSLANCIFDLYYITVLYCHSNNFKQTAFTDIYYITSRFDIS